MDHATLPQIGMDQAVNSGSGTSTSSDQGWIGWLKGLLPRQNRASKGDSNAPQAKFNTVWLNREAGSGADIIARQVAERLRWAVYNEEVVEVISRRMQVAPDLVKSLDELAPGMIQDWLLPLREQHYAPQETYLEHLEHLIQEVGRVGDAVIVGRGAGFLLPAERTLRVRIVAPLSNRASRLSDRMGVSVRTARRAARDLDRRRRQFDWALYRKESDDPHNYHMTLDSTALGIPICVDLITLAIVKGFPSGQFASSRVVNVDARGSDQTCVIVVDSKSQAPKS
jgi:cytidylate kinase